MCVCNLQCYLPSRTSRAALVWTSLHPAEDKTVLIQLNCHPLITLQYNRRTLRSVSNIILQYLCTLAAVQEIQRLVLSGDPIRDELPSCSLTSVSPSICPFVQQHFHHTLHD